MSVELRTVLLVNPERAVRIRRRVWTVLAVSFSAFCSLMTVGLASMSANTPAWNHGVGLVLNLVAAAALVWRHERPWLVLAIALVARSCSRPMPPPLSSRSSQ